MNFVVADSSTLPRNKIKLSANQSNFGRKMRTISVRLLLVVLAVIFLILHFRDRLEQNFNPVVEYDFEICIISRVKNVAYLLPQWLEYHILLGVDQFFIINDCSNDDGQTMFWAKFYEQEKHVTFYHNHTFSNCSPHIPGEGKLMDHLFQISKHRCNWIAVIDADEYIAPSSDSTYELAVSKQGDITEPFLKLILHKVVTNPIVRMPWFIMSSHGYELRPFGLITSKYIDGKFLPMGSILMKTLIQSRYVVSWTDSHHPLKFSWFTPAVSGQTLRDYNRPFLVQPREMTVTESCLVPRSPLLIRHYQALSWHDFNAIKRNRTLNSFGTPNAWAENPRHKWLEFNFSIAEVENKPINSNSTASSSVGHQPHCYRLGNVFRLQMDKAVKLSAQQRLQRYRGKSTLDYVGSRQDFRCWVYGQKLQPI